MYEPLARLEQINTKCRIQLTKTLSTRHQVRMVAGPGEFTADGCRGVAFFSAFDPWHTCLRSPPGAARFFDAAEKTGLISSQEAKMLSQALLRHGAHMATVYDGAFQSFFLEPRIKTILGHVDELDHLSESGLAVGASWADRLYETCPFPLQPDKHLEVRSFHEIAMAREIGFYSQSPWLAWIEALDLICVGPWAGLRPHEIMTMVEALRQNLTDGPVAPVGAIERILGQRVAVPLFSRGLQGVVFGLFTDVPKLKREPIITSIIQFGETLSDIYAGMRQDYFREALDADLDNDSLAREIINLVSPIGKIIIMREGRRVGYKLCHESNYLSGYQPLNSDEIEANISAASFSVNGPNGAEIYIEPVTHIPHLNQEFAIMRVEETLRRSLGSITTVKRGAVLSLAELQHLRSEFEAYAEDGGASLAKLRLFYVLSKLEQNWDIGQVKVTNSELKRFVEGELHREIKNGYQITSFAPDIEKLFGDKVAIAKTRNALSLAWSRGGHTKSPYT